VDESTADATENASHENPATTTPPGSGDTAEPAKSPGKLPGAFQRLFAAAIVSGIGDGLRYTALPLLAASIGNSSNTVALVTVAGMLPWLLFGLLAGVLAGRSDWRTLMWVTDFVRAVLVAGFAVLVAAGTLSIWLIVIFAFVVGSAQVVFDTAGRVPARVAGRPNPSRRGQRPSDVRPGADLAVHRPADRRPAVRRVRGLAVCWRRVLVPARRGQELHDTGDER
jgi:hypothetical protein